MAVNAATETIVAVKAINMPSKDEPRVPFLKILPIIFLKAPSLFSGRDVFLIVETISLLFSTVAA